MPEGLFSPDQAGQPKSPEVMASPEHHVPEAIIFDLDRMLGDVDASMARLYNAAAACNLDVEQIRVDQAKIEADGGTFEPLTLIREAIAAKHDAGEFADEALRETALNAEYESFRTHFITAEKPDVLFPDALRLLARVQHQDIPHAIMTYGVSSEWQQLKLEATGYPAGHLIMNHSDKGLEMPELKGPDGTYDFRVSTGGDAVYHAERLILIDDKAKSFRNLPPDCHGFLIVRGELLPSQKGEIPDNVEVIHSLDELEITPDGRIIIGDGTRHPAETKVDRRESGDVISLEQPATYLPHPNDDEKWAA